MGRRRYTADFKRKVVVEAMRGDTPVREIAARHGINPNQLSRWKTEVYDGLLEVFGDGAGGGAAARDTEKLIERLYARIGELVVERMSAFTHQGLLVHPLRLPTWTLRGRPSDFRAYS